MPSTRNLIEHHQKLQSAYGLKQDSSLFSILDMDAENVELSDSLNSLLNWLEKPGSDNE